MWRATKLVLGPVTAIAIGLMGCTVITSPGDYEGGDASYGTPCEDNADCSSGECDPMRGVCVECEVDSDCSDGSVCIDQVCGPVICGGDVCPDVTPVCVGGATDGICVECASASDCEFGQSCSDTFVCESCMPDVPCGAGEACVLDDAGDYCLDCDADGDGLIRQQPECAALAGDPDCDDDADGFCLALPECSDQCIDIIEDCDDSDESARPVLPACGGGAGPGCSDVGDLLTGDGVGSFTAFALTALPPPLADGIRTPMSLIVASDGDSFEVVFLSDPGDDGTYLGRSARSVNVNDREVSSVGLPDTGLRDFSDMRVKRDGGRVVVGVLGVDSDTDSRSVELVYLESLEGPPVSAANRFPDADAVPPIDVSRILGGALPQPYVVWPSSPPAGNVLKWASPSGASTDTVALGGEPDSVCTARGLVTASAQSMGDAVYWSLGSTDPVTESRDEGGALGFATAASTLGFDARFDGGALEVRTLTIVADSYLTSDSVKIDGADLATRVSLASHSDLGFIAFDGPTEEGQRRIFVSRLNDSGVSTAATTPLALTGDGVPDFEDIYGIETAARDSLTSGDVAILVHGLLAGTDEPALYLFAARRCTD